MSSGSTFLLAAGGTALGLEVAGSVPFITYWGRSPGSDAGFADELTATSAPAVMHSSFDSPRMISALPSQADGWSGTPALELHRDGVAVLPRFRALRVDVTTTAAAFVLVDDYAGVRLDLAYSFAPSGTLHVTSSLEHTGSGTLTVGALRVLMPLPRRASELLDMTGRWSGERRPQRGPVLDGSHVRASRRGRPGHDAATLEIVGTPGFGFRRGEVWAAHVAWSGDSQYVVERLSEGVGTADALLGGGELLGQGEVRLAHGQRYTSPEVVLVWSDAGIDGLSERLHSTVRAKPAYPRTPRPLTLNTWEAAYFDHRQETFVALADIAAEVGVERFVVDDGWFTARRDDTIGLGDWAVDRTVWTEGLEPLAAHVRSVGMEFGLWFEPEMVNPRSRIAIEHPEWVLAPADGAARTWRHQIALNLAIPAAWHHLADRMSALIAELGIAYIKWDHNRDLHEAIDRRTGVLGVHEQTLATYRLMDELRQRHPELEIESCASGGARVDLGVMEHAQRVWASDTNDAIERQRIQRWTSVLLPPELIGSHVGPDRSHTTDRIIALPFRLLTALLAHAGIEWDLSACTTDELAALTRWSDLYRRWRSDIATGTTVRGDDLPAGSNLLGLVSADRRRALYSWTQTEVGPLATSERVLLPGLDPRRTYTVRIDESLGRAARRSITDPAWTADAGSLRFSGALLGLAGLPLPVLHPAQGLLLVVESS